MSTQVRLHLNTLTCAVETEHGTEPYIWPILIGEEGGTAHLVSPTSEWAGKVLQQDMMAGQSVAIPAGMTSNLLQAFTNPAASLVVVIVALSDKDSSPQHGTAAVLQHIESRSLTFVQNHLAECRASSGDRNDLRNALVQTLDVGGAEADELSWSEQLATFFKSGGFDDSIGFAFLAFSGAEIRNRNLTFDLSGMGQQFSLTGSLALSTIVVLCQAQRDALAHAQAVLKGLQTQRQVLQEQLHHATPQQKPGIVAAINQVAAQEPAAEAAVAAAQAALEACLGEFGGTHGPLDHSVLIG
jgi:hypothetical protein